MKRDVSDKWNTLATKADIAEFKRQVIAALSIVAITGTAIAVAIIISALH